MPVPQFNENGILPEGIHDCTLTEAEKFFVQTPRRVDLWKKLSDFLDWIRPMNIFQSVYIDGSFLTDKPDPNDIDLLLELIPISKMSSQNKIDPKILDKDYIYKIFDLDIYISPEFLPTKHNDFRLFFQYIGVKEGLSRGLNAKDKKGIIKVII